MWSTKSETASASTRRTIRPTGLSKLPVRGRSRSGEGHRSWGLRLRVAVPAQIDDGCALPQKAKLFLKIPIDQSLALDDTGGDVPRLVLMRVEAEHRSFPEQVDREEGRSSRVADLDNGPLPGSPAESLE